MTILNLLKKVPIDLGQGNLRSTTKGKQIALSLVKEGEGKNALDVGCREGIQSEWLKKKCYNVTSIDIVKEYKDCQVVDVNKRLPFKNESFDLIWCSEVIEHLDNPEKTLKEFLRILKKEGEIIITTPNSYALIFKFLYLFGITPKMLQRKDHKHFFNIKYVKKMLPKSEVYGFFPYFLFKKKIKNLVGLLSPTFIIFFKKRDRI